MVRVNTKPMKEWTYDELMAEAAWMVVEAITKGEPLKRAMYGVDTLIKNWRREQLSHDPRP